jgi:hypothetical protein
MKTTVTNLRNCLTALLLTLACSNAFSQNSISANTTNTTISNLQVGVDNNNLVINWNVSESVNSDYCQVQASNDGVNFSTIGMVMGADPKNPGSFKFKQNIQKVKSGKIFYRILNVENSGRSYVSDIVKAA